MVIREIHCTSALTRCGFPEKGLAINPYAGCAHACVYCFARSIRRPSKDKKEWGAFVDIQKNIAKVLAKQMKSSLWKGEDIFIGTVTDPYQPVEAEYGLTRKILTVLSAYDNPVHIFTKSDSIIRDSDILKKMKRVSVHITITTHDKEWTRHTEPGSPSLAKRFEAIKTLSRESISVVVPVSPYWPSGVEEVVSESLNVVSGNWMGVEAILKAEYPDMFQTMHDIFFNRNIFSQFYHRARGDIERAGRKYDISVTAYFGLGYAKKFGKLDSRSSLE